MGGCGCGCNDECGADKSLAPIGSTGSFGYPMGPDGVPVSLRLPGYQAVPGSIPGFNAPIPLSAANAPAPDAPASTGDGGSVFDQAIGGCPLWIWGVAVALVFLERHKR